MMRYQRVSPDCLPLANGRKSNPRSCKEEEADNGRLSVYTSNGSSGGGFDGKSLRYRPGTSPSSTTTQDQNFTPPLAASESPQSGSPHHHASRAVHEGSGASGSPGGDVILQWGHNKRSRGSRAESRITAASAAGGDETVSQARQVIKIHRRTVVGGGGEKLNSMPPPSGSGSYSRGTNLRPAIPIRDHHHHTGSLLNRTTPDDHRAATASPSRTHNGTSSRAHPHRTTASLTPAEKRSSSSPDKPDHHHTSTTTNNYNHNKPSPNNHHKDSKSTAAVGGSEPATPQSETAAGAAVEKVSLEAFEWPRIYISLSRKEKEDDFLVMKGTKLPQRPKKRAKNVDKTLQYCFPGMWLSDLTRGRYEVREKKCVKKRRRGLKGMESMDSESE